MSVTGPLYIVVEFNGENQNITSTFRPAALKVDELKAKICLNLHLTKAVYGFRLTFCSLEYLVNFTPRFAKEYVLLCYIYLVRFIVLANLIF